MLDTILSTLRRDPAFMKNVIAWERSPARPSQPADVPTDLAPVLVDLLQQRGTWPLYRHQAQAITAALRGENVVVATGTASGKTLCYNLPVLQELHHHPAASALYLFPTKALAQDQLAELTELTGRLIDRPEINLYDGDTPVGRRPAVRRAGGVVLSNPDMLHAGILPHHTRWAQLFANLRFVVLDEIHAYRGVFGSHLANLVRRLRRIIRLYGGEPQFICTSATIANPAAHARRLIEAPVTLVGEDQDGSPQGERHFILFNPPMVNSDLGIRQASADVAVRIAAEFLSADAQTVLFARSRLQTELLLTALRDRLSPHVLPAEQLQGYRGGYLPNERRAIERGLRTGQIRGVTATNALELGVDVGELSACLLVGYPGSIASTRQQAGRAGRRLASSVAVLVATASPLDQYIALHPHYLFERSPEHALINPNNLVILVNHLKCAAFELPLEAGESYGDAGEVGEILDFLTAAGLLVADHGRYHWVADDYPAASISLRSGSSETVVIEDLSEPGRPTVIGQMERESAPLLLHQGAIYPHLGQTYLVEALQWEDARALVRPVEVEYYTRASINRTLQVLQVAHSAVDGPIVKHEGWVKVISQATAYRKIKRSTHETLGWGDIDLPPQELETTAYWVTLTPELTHQMEQAGILPGPVDYGPNWSAQKTRVLVRDGGRCQGCGARERPGRRHDVHHLRPFREFDYQPGVNQAYLQANALENLVTLCPACHRRAEARVRMRSGLAGLASLFRNLAPLFLMCDVHDIFVLAELQPAGGGEPAVTIYERLPAGVGFSQHLYEVHRDLLLASQELITACPCLDGCPACVGPPGEVGPATKEATRELLEAMLATEDRVGPRAFP
jgi:DEAD/DEAH box helicase domain-containing protein